jgi:hypothetical protein
MKRLELLAAWALALTACGCSPPAATLDLLTVARMGLSSAKEAQQEQHSAILEHVRQRAGALDAAFDSDVRLAASGGIRDATGEPVALTAEWVISARKGYAAARDAMAREAQGADAAHAVRMDNLAAADEALQMAAQLVSLQWDLDARVRGQLLAAQRRLVGK